MPRTCTVCQHPQAAEVAQALTQHVSLRALAQRFGITKSAINRHALTCVPTAVQMAQTTLTAAPVLDV